MNHKIYYPTQGTRIYGAYLELLSRDASLKNVRGCGLADFLLILHAYMVRYLSGDTLLLTADDLALLLHTLPESIPNQLMKLVKAGLLAYRMVEADVYEFTILKAEQFLPQNKHDVGHYLYLSPQVLEKLDHLTYGKWHSRLDCLLDIWLHTIWQAPGISISKHLPIFWSEDCCDTDGWVSLSSLSNRWGYNAVLTQANFTQMLRYVDNHYENGHGYLLMPRCVQRLHTEEFISGSKHRRAIRAAVEEVHHEH